ncbi:hypothetical protein [Cryobacterium sp. Y11]|jgi:hypothetical protein|uniref:hypothetical protein n=1 Tax=Cryobacterium sp. Y11 TaxID=2045016 RepID=UPI000CE45E15|nr:hypothetical protein [Cryobacterium sp. Y11]
MSDNLARVSFEAEPTQVETSVYRPFRIVSSAPSRRTRPRIFYALTAVAGMAAIIVAQLLLSVGISQGAYEIAGLQSSQSTLARTAASVTEDLAKVSSPQSLAANAEGLGLVTNSNPVYLRLSDGAVLGAPASASGSQAGAASLVPNALLAGSPVLSQLSSDAAAKSAGTVAITSAPVVPAGLAAPTTR